MLWKRFLVQLTLLLGLGSQLTRVEALDSISLNGFPVHPTHILARVLEQGDGTLATVRPQVVALLSSMGLTIRYEYSLVPGLLLIEPAAQGIEPSAVANSSVLAQILQSRIDSLRGSGLFAYVTPDSVVQANALPDDLKFTDGTLWGLRNTGQNGGVAGADINAAGAWNVTTGTNSVVVAVIDTGVRYTHSDLAANIWVNSKEIPGNGIDDDGNGVVDDVHGFNAITGSGNPFDDNGHGTHVSGTIGAAANNGSPHVGVCWNVAIMGLKFLSANGSGINSDAIKCLQYAVNNGAKISNNSWGGPGGGDGDVPLAEAINQAGAKGHFFIAAAGNNGTDDDLVPFSPASFALPTMLSVAALDRKDQLAWFSCYGRRTVNLGAPGVEIFSTWATGDTDYMVEQGTSMATPHVVGVAALTLASHPKANTLELRQRVLNSVVQIPALQGITTTGGRVNAFNAVNSGPSGSLQVVVAPPDKSALLQGPTSIPFYVTVSDIFPITNATVACTVTDPSGNQSPLAFKNDGTTGDLTGNDNIYTGQFSTTNAGQYSFLFVVNAPKETGVIFTNTYTVTFPPPNDSFAHPRKVAPSGGVLTDTNSLATLQTGEPLHGNISTVAASLWYSYSAPADGSVLVDTFHSQFATVLAVYTGSSLSTLKQVTSAAGTGGNPGVAVVFDAKKSSTYWIAVASVSSDSTGILQLELQPGGVLDVVPPIVKVIGLVDGALVTTNKLSLHGTAADPQPTPSGVASVQISLNSSIAVAASGTTNWNTLSPLTLSPGANTISVVSYDFAGNSSAPLVYNVYYRVPTQGNDAFALGYTLTGTNITTTGNNTGATKEVGEPAHAGNEGGHSIWWTFTPSFSGLLTADTIGSGFDTLLGIYTGDYVNNLTTVAFNDDFSAGSGVSKVQFSVVAGVPLHIAVDGFGGAVGSVKLNVKLASANLVAVTITNGTGGTVSLSSGSYVSNSVQTVQAFANPGYTFVNWTGSSVSFVNPLTFNARSGTSLQANFVPNTYSDDFESGNLRKLAWTTSGNAVWAVQSADASSGTYSARSGSISDGQSSSLLLTTNSVGGTAGFDYKVSSEAGFDQLSFYLDGSLLQQWSGETDWSTFSFALTSGTHTFEWRYSKDPNGTSGTDAAWIDNVQLHIRPEATSASVAHMTMLGVKSGAAQLLVDGQIDQIYITQWSRALSGWTPLKTNVNSLGSYLITPPVSTNEVRFYRAITAP